MGEVYKAEDLKLNQTVALKFLPEHFAEDRAARERFFGEVRTARQVSHPNVCRVFDIEEMEGSHFLSMEFIDGDDLSSLLRRIGRLPPDKAVEIARQLCAGLHAVHQAGILHRDFKPANMMIDERGKARITDFGIAGLERELKDGGVAGTRAYMSPEQITGNELTTKSDIYSLGLVLYEIFTGKQAFAGDTINELLRQHKNTAPTTPSEVIKDIDPLVEKVILRCLEKDPRERPASALQVAMMLPGGNPLEAAIAAGETPSPEMVAPAPKKGALEPFVRRRWSESIISWSRLMAGDFRDPLVGRDILIGGLLGLCQTAAIYLGVLLPQWLAIASLPISGGNFTEPLSGVRGMAVHFLHISAEPVFFAVFYSFLLLILLAVLRKNGWRYRRFGYSWLSLFV